MMMKILFRSVFFYDVVVCVSPLCEYDACFILLISSHTSDVMNIHFDDAFDNLV